MKNLSFSLAGLCLLFCFSSFAQSPNQKWKGKPFDYKVFVENKGQFSAKDNAPGAQVFYGADVLGTQIYYSPTGLLYRIDRTETDPKMYAELLREEAKRRGKEEGEAEMKRERELRDKMYVTRTSMVRMEWLNANPSVKILSEGQVKEYFNYDMTRENMENVYYAKGFTKLIYKDLYKGIDAEYSFHPKEGTKYNLIVHPGADVSQIKMRYTGADAVTIDANGNIHLKTQFGDIIDHAPLSFYQDGKPVGSSFSLNDNTVSFDLQPTIINQRSTIIIDPWTTNPQWTPLNKAFHVAVDAAGNSYIYGSNTPFKVRKYDVNGVALWSYNTPWNNANWFGDLVVDKPGNVYITPGTANIQKLTTAGTVVWTNNAAFLEAFCLRFDVSQTNLMCAGAVGASSMAFVNQTTGAITGKVNVNGSGNSIEIRALTTSYDCNFYALTTTGISGTPASRLLSVTPGLSNVYNVASCHNGTDFPYFSPAYVVGTGSLGSGASGLNGIAAGYNFVFTYDGINLCKYSLTTGVNLKTIVVTGGTAGANSGILVDSCENVYVGTGSSIVKYDTSLTQLTSVTTPPVFDLAFGLNKEIVACGDTFVGSYTGLVQTCNKPAPSLTLNAGSNSTACGGATGSASVSVSGGISPYTYTWSNGATSSSITGLSAGIYTVTVSDASCNILVASKTVQITGGGNLSALTAQSNVLCNGGSNGSGSVTASGGGGAYTYSWTPTGGNGSSATGLTAGTYTVTITDSSGCSNTQTILINQPSAIVVTGTGGTICPGECINITANASGGTGNISYTWNPGNLSGSTVNVCPTSTTNYTVTATDANGCTKTAVATVTVNPKPTAAFNANPSSGQIPLNVTFTNTSSGGTSYTWTFGDGSGSSSQNTNHTYVSSGSYTVKLVVTNSNGCKDSIMVTIIAEDLSTLIVPNVFSPNGDGYNDLFTINTKGMKDLYVEIYDRWGLKMGSFSDLNGGWDGKAASGKDAPEGTYYYVLKAHGNDSKEYDLHGYLMLLRK